MSLRTLTEQMPAYARDIKINLLSLLDLERLDGLTPHQLYGVALATAYTAKSLKLAKALLAEAGEHVSDDSVQAVKAAVAIMGMNNIYFRFTQHASDEAYKQMPPGLRMQVIGKPGIDKLDFELIALAVSMVNHCYYCVESHTDLVVKGGVSKEGVALVARVAAVVKAAADVLAMEEE